jgi:hypothetical protein
MHWVQELADLTGEKQRKFYQFYYGAGTWKKRRKVIAKLGGGLLKGRNRPSLSPTLRAINSTSTTNSIAPENRIKEQQLGLFADRTGTHHWWANQFRLLLSSLAYVLMDGILRLDLNGTELARAQMSTIRLKMHKIGAVIIRNTRRIRFLLSNAYPYQTFFFEVTARLKPD